MSFKEDPLIQLQRLFAAQRSAFAQAAAPNCAVRIEHLQQLANLLVSNQTQILEAVAQDFGCRSSYETLLAEIGMVLQAIRYACKHLPRWMQKKRCTIDISLWPARAYTLQRPKGVVGIIAPWNYPVQLCLLPLVDALAAGCRVMLKPSELTPHTAQLLKNLLGKCFPDEQVAVVITNTASDAQDTATEHRDVSSSLALAQAFTQLPFDHLLFTGSERVGRQVAQAAAKNLTPVTLELGGKSPLIVGDDLSLERAAEMIGIGKLFSAGQTCIAPDYVLAPAAKTGALAEACLAWAQKNYPDILNNAAYTSIISARHYQRLQHLVEEAKVKGSKVFSAETFSEAHQQHRKFPFTLILEPPSDTRVMREEIFGPLLPIMGYHSIEEAIDFVRARAHPLAAYALFKNARVGERVIRTICSGSSSINAPLLQQTVNSLPFGGIGASGMGSYHGEAGFSTFSHKQSFFVTPDWHLYRYIKPPFGFIYNVFKRLLFRR